MDKQRLSCSWRKDWNKHQRKRTIVECQLDASIGPLRVSQAPLGLRRTGPRSVARVVLPVILHRHRQNRGSCQLLSVPSYFPMRADRVVLRGAFKGCSTNVDSVAEEIVRALVIGPENEKQTKI